MQQQQQQPQAQQQQPQTGAASVPSNAAASVVAPSHLVYQELASGQIQMYQLPPGFVPVLVSNTGSLQPLVSIPPQAATQQQQPPPLEVTNTLSVPQDPNGSRRSSSAASTGSTMMVMQQQQPQPQQQQQPQMELHYQADVMEQIPPPQPTDYIQQQQPQPEQQQQQQHVYLQHPVVDNYVPVEAAAATAAQAQPQQYLTQTGSDQQVVTSSDNFEHYSTSVSAVSTAAALHLLENEDRLVLAASGPGEAVEASPSPQPGGIPVDYLENATEAEVAAAMMAGGGFGGEAAAGEDSNMSTQGKSDVSEESRAAAVCKSASCVTSATSLCSSTSSLSSSFSCTSNADHQIYLQNQAFLHANSQPSQIRSAPAYHQSISLEQDFQQQHREAAAQFRKSSVPTHQIQIHAEALLRRGSLPPALTSILANQLEASNRLTSRRSSSGTIATLATLRESHGDSDISLEDLSQVK